MIPNHAEITLSAEARRRLKQLQGFVSYGFRTAQHLLPTDFFLIHADHSGLRFSIEMIDLAERLEVGAIRVEPLESAYGPEAQFPFPKEIDGSFSAQRLVLHAAQSEIDSGLSLSGSHGVEILMLPGAYPFSIAVRGLPALPRFEPEYGIERYERRAL